MSLVEVVVVVDVDMDAAVVVAVVTIVTLPIMRDRSLTVGLLPVKVPLKEGILGGLVRGVAMVDLVDLTGVAVAAAAAAVAVLVSVMEKLVMWNALEGHLNAVAELGAGEYFFLNISF